MKNRTNTDRTSKLPALTLLLCAMFALLGVNVAVGQCIPHPEQRTVVLFANETKYDLTFFIDLDETGVAVPSKAVSPEQPVASGEHIFRARGIVGERAVWVWMIDEVPAGNVCTWIITDPAESTLPHSRKKQQE